MNVADRNVSGLRGRERLVHVLFEIGIFGKAFDGVMEVLGGVLLLVLAPQRLNTVVRLLTQHELSEDPTDVVARLLVHSMQHLAGDASTKVFGAVFLLWHGAIKIGLVWGLLRRRAWAYPVAIAAFGAFVAYQIYRYLHTHSVWLIALSLLDVLVILLTWLEYQRLRGSHAFRQRRTRA